MTWFLVKLGIRLLAFTAVFWAATRPRRGDRARKGEGAPEVKGARPQGKPPRLVIQPRWAIPVVGMLFAVLNTALYWLLKPILNVATLSSMALVMPLVVNGLLLWGTARIVQKKGWLKLDGAVAAVWLALILTVTHGVLYFALDYF